MGASQYSLTPATVVDNFTVLSNLKEKTKLRSSSDGAISIEERFGAWLWRKGGSFDIAAVEMTFQKAVEIMLQSQNDADASLKNYATEITEKFNDAVTVGLVRQFNVYQADKNTESAKRFAKLAMDSIKKYNDLQPNADFHIKLNGRVKTRMEDALLEEALKKAIIPAPPKAPPKKEKKKTEALTDAEKKLQQGILKSTQSYSPVGFLLLEGLGKVNLRAVGARVMAEQMKRTTDQTQLFDNKLLNQAKERDDQQSIKRRKGKQPDPVPDDSLIVALAARRAHIDGKKEA